MNCKNAFEKYVQSKVAEINKSKIKWYICNWYNQGMQTVDKQTSTNGSLAGKGTDLNEQNKTVSSDVVLHIMTLKPNNSNEEFLNSLIWKYDT